MTLQTIDPDAVYYVDQVKTLEQQLADAKAQLSAANERLTKIVAGLTDEIATRQSKLEALQAQYGSTYNGMLTARADRDELQSRLQAGLEAFDAFIANCASAGMTFGDGSCVWAIRKALAVEIGSNKS